MVCIKRSLFTDFSRLLAKTQHRDIQFLMIAQAHLSEARFDTSCSLIVDGSFLSNLRFLTVLDGIF